MLCADSSSKMANSVKFIFPLLEETFDKVYYKSCIVRNELQIQVGDTVAVKYNTGKWEFFGKILTLYEDMSVRTMNLAGSTLSPFKADILMYFDAGSVPAHVKIEKVSQNGLMNLYIPLLNDNYLIKGSFRTVEIPKISDCKQIVFRHAHCESGVNNSQFDNNDENMEKLVKIRLIRGFDEKNGDLDPKITLETSFEYSTRFIKRILNTIEIAHRQNRRSPLLKIFRIEDWLEPSLNKLLVKDNEKYDVKHENNSGRVGNITNSHKNSQNNKIITNKMKNIQNDKNSNKSPKIIDRNVINNDKINGNILNPKINEKILEKSIEIKNNTKSHENITKITKINDNKNNTKINDNNKINNKNSLYDKISNNINNIKIDKLENKLSNNTQAQLKNTKSRNSNVISSPAQSMNSKSPTESAGSQDLLSVDSARGKKRKFESTHAQIMNSTNISTNISNIKNDENIKNIKIDNVKNNINMKINGENVKNIKNNRENSIDSTLNVSSINENTKIIDKSKLRKSPRKTAAENRISKNLTKINLNEKKFNPFNQISESHEQHDPLKHREFEYTNIKNYIENCLTNNKSGSLYISGLPGCGKTATLERVCVNYKDAPKMIYIYINGANYTRSSDILVEIGSRLFNRRYPCKKALHLLDVFYKCKHDCFTLLVIDEFDNVCQNDKYVWYNLAEWTTFDTSKIIFVACANTLDLPERLLTKQVSSRLSFHRVFFNTYNFMQLQEILHSTITHHFEANALSLLTKKVSAVCGDYRKCFRMAEKALEIARNNSHELVKMSDVDEAFKSFAKPREALIKCLQYQARTFLGCLIDLSKKSSDEHVTVNDVYSEVVNVYKSNNDQPPTIDNMISIATMLQEHGLISHLTKLGVYSKIKGNFLPSSIE